MTEALSKYTEKQCESIWAQCFISIPPKYVRKPLVKNRLIIG